MSGWAVDLWEPSAEALSRLAEAYKKLISPVKREMERLLQADGVDLDVVFTPEGARVEETTRADAVELCAAGTAIAVEQVSLDLIHMPNVPKASRKYSSRGIDILAADVDTARAGHDLHDDERIIVYSVKHSVTNTDDLVRKLIASVSPKALTQAYVFEQLRVLHGRLQERGYDLDRIFRVVGNFHTNPHVTIIAVGAASAGSRKEYAESLRLLPQASGERRLRQLFVRDIERLDQRMK